MFSLKHLIGLVLTSLMFVSCAPFPPEKGPGKTDPNAKKVPDATEVEAPKTPEELAKEEARRKARIKANKEAAARRAALKKKKEAEKKVSDVTPPVVEKKDPVKPKSKYRTAVAIPGKPGFVFNPWTNKAVDVRGVPGGMLVRDPNDGNPDHKFRVP